MLHKSDHIAKKEALVSVIVPNYNYAHFLCQRIGTILNQTYKNIEIIILDDCSTDNSRTVIESYRHCDKIKKIEYNSCNSGSTFKQWQKGFLMAKGDFIWIAECDDYADPCFLEKIVPVMQNDKEIKIGFSNSYWVTPESTFINHDYTISSLQKVYNGKKFVRQHLMKENYIYNASMAVFRKDALKYVDPNFINYKSCGDKLFWGSMAASGKVLYHCEPLNHFRIHSTKVTTKSIANGVLFHEEYELFKKNIQNGYITIKNRWQTVAYFQQYVMRMKTSFLTQDIYNTCLDLWRKEADYKNKELPFLYRLLCFFKVRLNKQRKNI